MPDRILETDGETITLPKWLVGHTGPLIVKTPIATIRFSYPFDTPMGDSDRQLADIWPDEMPPRDSCKNAHLYPYFLEIYVGESDEPHLYVVGNPTD